MFGCDYCKLEARETGRVPSTCPHHLTLAIEPRTGRYFALGLLGGQRRYEKGPFDTREQAVSEARKFGTEAARLMGPQHVRYHDELKTDWAS